MKLIILSLGCMIIFGGLQSFLASCSHFLVFPFSFCLCSSPSPSHVFTMHLFACMCSWQMCAAVLCACFKKFPSMLQCLDLILFLTFVLNCRFLRSITLLLDSEHSHPVLPSRLLVMDNQVALTSPHPKHSCNEHPCNAFM